MKKVIFAIVILVLLVGCVARGIRPMKSSSHDGSIGSDVRYEAAKPKYHLVVKNPAKTNIVAVGLRDGDGTLLTNVNFIVVKPADLIKVRMKDDVDLTEPSFLKKVIINQGITLIVVLVLITLVGWRNVKLFFKSTFGKNEKKI